MPTNNSWNNAINSGNNAITLNSGTSALNISTDSAATTVSIATGGAVKSATLGSTNSTSATTVQSGSGALNVTSTNGSLTVNSGTGALGISTDASATTVSFATGGAVKTVTLGSNNSTSTTTVQSGSGALNITSTNGSQTHNSGTGAMGISTDASATTVSIATGAAVKTVTLGSTNSTSSTAIKSGTGNIALNSGLTIDSSGRNKNSVQPAFHAYQNVSASNVTGDGTVYTLALDTELIDQGNNFNNATYTFTAPVAGFYFFSMAALLTGVGSQTTLQLVIGVNYPTTTYNGAYISPTNARAAGNNLGQNFSLAIPLSASDAVTFKVIVTGGTKTIGVNGVAGQTFACGYLIC